MSNPNAPRSPRSNAPKSTRSAASKPTSTPASKPAVVTTEARAVQSSTVTHVGPINTMALVGFILSIASIVVSITAVPGVILSHIGLKQTKEKGEPGHGFALAGVIVGYCVIGLWALVFVVMVLYVIFFIILFGGIFAASSPYWRVA